MDAVIAAFNAAAAGALTATRAHTSSDRGRGGGAIRLELSGTNVIGTPFHLTSLPIAANADLPSVAAAMANAARAYEQVKQTAGPIIRKHSMTAKAQGLGTQFDGLMARLDRVAADATKRVTDAVDKFEHSARTNSDGIAKTIDAARVSFEDKINQISNGAPPGPLPDSVSSLQQSTEQGAA